MKGFQRIIGVTSMILFIQTSVASTGSLFQITETGSPGAVSITLCLNGKGPLSCQNFTVSKLNLSILTTIPNHNYPAVGIKINTQGYTIDNIGGVCTPISNGYCLFSASHDLAKFITLKGPAPTPTIQPAIAAGAYSIGITSRPLLASSFDGGMTWTYTINSTNPVLPADINGLANLNEAASCSESNCIAIGSYYIGATQRPLIASSSDGGMTWAYTLDSTHPVLPAGINGLAILNGGASCSGSHCIAAGFYFIGATQRHPLLASSSDGGMTWTYTINGTNPVLPADINGSASLTRGASCSGSNCIAAGSYFIGATQLPLLASSSDGGMTWTYTINSTNPVLPADRTGFATFTRGASCSGSHCIAAGSYLGGTAVYPLLASSSDGGMTWDYTINSTNPALPADGNGSARLDGNASCSGSHCVVAGYYSSAANIRPLLASSNDGGMTWAYTLDATHPALPADINGFAIFDGGVSCSSSYCIAAGSYFNGTATRPLLASSSDGGLTWAYRINSTYPGLPADSNGNARLDESASCSGTYCIVTGSYFNGTATYPLLASSFDGGITWAYTINSTYPAVPTDTNGSVFLSGGASVSNSVYLSDSLLFLKKN